MDNHVHLLIQENEEEIASIMKRIGVRYVAWYNRNMTDAATYSKTVLRVRP